MLLILVIGVPAYIYWIFAGFSSPTKNKHAIEIMTAQSSLDVSTGTPESLFVGQIVLLTTQTVQPTYTFQPTYTPQATFTPSVDWLRGSPVPTKNSFSPDQVNWVFSYYWPALVAKDYPKYAANCHPDNILTSNTGKVNGCKDTTASGEPWSTHLMYKDLQYMGGVAVPYYPNTYNPIYPMGSVIHVSSPSIMAGDYLVLDICPACDDYISTHNVLFLDFLARGLPDNVTFWDPVKVDSVVYPSD